MRKILTLMIVAIGFGLCAYADNIFIGDDTNGPVTVYTTGGTFVQNFGQGGATGSAINTAGDVWTVAPNFGANHIVEYDPAQNVLNSFVEPANGEWVEDMSHGLGNTMYLGTFEGNVITINDTTGAIMSEFAVPNSTFTGVAYDSSTGNLWLSGGLASDNLFEYTTGGTLLATIPISTTCGGLGWDITDNTLWCGDFGVMHHYDTMGNLLGSFNTMSGNYHDGVETVNLPSGNTVPEPSTFVPLGGALAGICFLLRRRVLRA